ncbi:hypothetical protein [Chakrabartyella piscis]|uniref:hypothetical protein n=1 Tax=Chakrabartyella piscis TaxID=2918914 RepID=UPI002958B119|nr:hypothetical protein [Chakrabartyella piscis]
MAIAIIYGLSVLPSRLVTLNLIYQNSNFLDSTLQAKAEWNSKIIYSLLTLLLKQ